MELAKKETRAVLGLRLLVFAVLLIAAIAVSLIVYFITANSEEEEYTTQYEGAAKQIAEAFLGVVDIRLPAISALGVATIAHGRDHGDQYWPFVTLSSFQERASTARRQSLSLYVHINPLVELDLREDWENFAAESPDAVWMDEGMDYQNSVGLSFVQSVPAPRKHYNRTAPWPIWYYDLDNQVTTDRSKGPYFPTWQQSPIVYNGVETNENILANKDGQNSGANITFTSESVAISQFIMAPPGGMASNTPSTALIALIMSIAASQVEEGDEAAAEPTYIEYQGDPISKVYFPIYDEFDASRKPVAIMLAWIRWASYFENVLPASLEGIVIVLQDSCGGQFTYMINGSEVIPLGTGDLHDTGFDNLKRSFDFSTVKNIADGTKFGLALNQEFCPISLDIYPSETFHEIFTTSTPVSMTVAVALVFVFTALMFLVYDRLVERRQELVMRKAAQTNAIVSSLFPANVRDRLLNTSEHSQRNSVGGSRRRSSVGSSTKGMTLDDFGMGDSDLNAAPIADLFPHCTVCFADIAGFTAWSSTRDPAQVFILLQHVYASFDKIAKRRKVFKVETIGDSYVAVTGLPEPQANHAVIMARFAGECKIKMNEVTAQLESSLGPETADLTMRFGMNSGPVTAGVLRGDRARFQLFGDTVNTAARMESLGTKNKIQMSQSTYDLLVAGGKSSWATARPDQVKAKGKGLLKTYWLVIKSSKSTGSTSGSSEGGQSDNGKARSQLGLPSKSMVKQDRLVSWVVEMLHAYLLKVVMLRKADPNNLFKATAALTKQAHGATSLDEVAEVIYLPQFDRRGFDEATKSHRKEVEVPENVLSELREYVTIIAESYLDNPFHNFEHACHVTQSTHKLLTRIVSKEVAVAEDGDIGELASMLHAQSLGINSDPLSSLAILFSALIHDAGHRGVSNAQLAIEDKEMGDKYRNKSIAEQHSLDSSWDLLMTEGKFEALRKCLFTSETEMKRFRQVLVNVVLATDIFDKELNDLRKNRWQKAFSSSNTGLTEKESNDLRATIVIEHIIQASDVSHTMQHWHIYRKWNKRLFQELYLAYRQGRMAKDPSKFWYNGEIGFFDNYIIPLAKKLKDCNVFGVSSDECLNYAVMNRNEWEETGQSIVEEMKQELSLLEASAGISSAQELGTALTEDSNA